MNRRPTTRDDALPPGLTAGAMVFEVAMAAGQDGAAPTPPEWIQLTPRGPVTARDGRAFSFDPEQLVAAHAAGGIHLPIDFEHETEFTMMLGSKPARGWIVALEARTEGLFGRVEWLADAVAALAARSYRYISPTFWRAEDGVSARLMKGAALVTSPALSMPAVASAAPAQDTTMLKDILAQLGLAETATAAEAIAAVATLKAGDPTKFVPVAQHEATATALAAAQAEIQLGKDAAQTALCAALVDGGVKAGKIAPAAKSHYLALAAAAFDLTKATIEALPVVIKPGTETVIASGEGGDAADPVKLAGKARAYMDEQAGRGIIISASEAIAHLQGGVS